jgi:hypothetical protein
MGAAYSELGPLGRDLAIWEIHLKSSGKSPHTVKSYIQGVRALAGFLTDQGLSLDPERITTSQLRAFQAHLLLPVDQGSAGKRTSTSHGSTLVLHHVPCDSDSLTVRGRLRDAFRDDERHPPLDIDL